MPETKTKLIFKTTPGLIAWPCTIRVPQDDGKHQEQEITARFKIVSQARIDELYAPAAAGRLTGNPDTELLKDALDGFDGLKDEVGAPVSDDAAKATLLALPYVVDGLARGYFEMLGRRTAKN